MCVFLRSMCLKFLLRDDFERLLCWLDHWLSCMLDCIHVYVFHSRKTGFKKWFDTSSIPPWHLAVCRDSSAVSYRFPYSFWIPGGSIEKAPASSIASRHLVDRSSFCSWIWWVVPRYRLDTSFVHNHFLNAYLDSFLDTSQHLHLSSFTKGLYIHSSRSDSHFFNLSQSVRTCSSLKHSLSHSKPLPLWFFKLFQDSSSLGKFLISYSSCISYFET